MASFRHVGIGFLAASLGGYGCSASTSGPATIAAADETGTEVLGEDAEPTEDTAPPPPLEYPPGPYGKVAGNVIPNLTWEGYRDGTGEWTTISLLDYFDPDGSRGIHAIKLGAAALW